MANAPDPSTSPAAEEPLQGWKEIARYLDRDQRTARRWEAEEGLPIRRHRTDRRSSVYAYPSQIDAWRMSRDLKPASMPLSESPRPAAISPLLLWGGMTAAAVLAGFFWMLHSVRLDTVAQAGASAIGGLQTTELCRGCDSLGKISPDGRYLSETHWMQSGDIGIRDLESGEIRLLGSKKSYDGSKGEANFSVFSPDGSRIAYNFLVVPDGQPGWEIRVISASGEGEPEKTVYFNPDFRYISPAGWTQDGRLLVRFQRGDWSNGIGFISLETGKLEVLRTAAPGNAVLSPDDRWIVRDERASSEASERDLYLLASDGSAERHITAHAADDFVMGFHPG